MNDAEPTLDNLNGLSEAAREGIRDSRLEAEYRPNQGQKPQTLHPLGFHRGLEYEVWQDEKHLGSGMNGSIVILQRKIHPQPLQLVQGVPELRAVKIIPVYEGKSKYYLRELECMIKFSRQAYSNFFVRFLGWYKFDHRLHIISEYCELGDLKDYIKKHDGRLPEDQVKQVSWQVLQGLVAMHKEGCVHGDIKPSVSSSLQPSFPEIQEEVNLRLTMPILKNVLVIKSPPDHWWVKLCDLGLSKRVEQSKGTTSTHYSRGFCPPEKLRLVDNDDGRVIDEYKADMWCFGEFVFQALTGQATFKSTTDIDRWCRKGTGFPDNRIRETGASEDALDFLHLVMVSEPSRRLAAPQACEHRWMKKRLDVPERRFPPSDGPSYQSFRENQSMGWTPQIGAAPSAPLHNYYGVYRAPITPYGTNSMSYSPYTAPIPAMSTSTMASSGGEHPGSSLSTLYDPYSGNYYNIQNDSYYEARLPYRNGPPRMYYGSGPYPVLPRPGVLNSLGHYEWQSNYMRRRMGLPQIGDFEDPEPQHATLPPSSPTNSQPQAQYPQFFGPASKGPDAALQELLDSTAKAKNQATVNAETKGSVSPGKSAARSSRRHSKPKKEAALAELKVFAKSFQLATPVPSDLVGILAKDPEKQKIILSKRQESQPTRETTGQGHATDNRDEGLKKAESPPLALKSPSSHVEAPATTERPRSIANSKPMTWAQRVAQRPAARPASVGSGGVTAAAAAA